MNTSDIGQVRFSGDYTHLIDNQGRRVELDDPRVVHVWPLDINPFAMRLIGAFFSGRGWRFRPSGRTTPEVLRYARDMCSGRECLPFSSIAGSVFLDLKKNRAPGEISIYYNLDQDGPCQNGAWPVIWETFSRRLGVRDAVLFTCTNEKTNYVGQGASLARDLATAVAVGDILEEARNTLTCLAVDKSAALKVFEEETERVVGSAVKGKGALTRAAKKWASAVGVLPLRSEVARTPRVILFGGLNVMFVQKPITEFFTDRGVIVKVVDLGEGINWIQAENLVRYGIKRGRLLPKHIYSVPSLLMDVLRPGGSSWKAREALKSRFLLRGLEFYARKYRRLMDNSGLLFAGHVSFYELLEEAARVVSFAGFSETPITVGRFQASVKSGTFDGAINVGCYNCQPAMNSQAIIRPLANACDIPYAAIDCEGPWISANQRRLLDAVAVQAKRVRTQKIQTGRTSPS